MKMMITNLKKQAKKLKREIGALYLAYQRPDVSLLAKIVAIIVVGYALSPIDLIPDFIPVLGFLDDIILLPLGIYFAIKLIPKAIILECRRDAVHLFDQGKPKNYWAAMIVVMVWVLLGVLLLGCFIERNW